MLSKIKEFEAKSEEFKKTELRKLEEISTLEERLNQEKMDISAQRKLLTDQQNSFTEKQNELDAKSRSVAKESQKASQIKSESIHALQTAENMGKEVERDREMLLSREARVLEVEKDVGRLQEKLQSQNLELVNSLEAVSKKEMAAAVRLKEAEMKLQEALRRDQLYEENVLRWEAQISEAQYKSEKAEQSLQHIKMEASLLEASRNSLRSLESELRQREWKLNDSWAKVKAEISQSLENSGDEALLKFCILDSDDSLNVDSSMAQMYAAQNSLALESFDGTKSKEEMMAVMYKSWSEAAKKETLLQRWAVSLSLEASRLKNAAQRIHFTQQESEQRCSQAQQDRQNAEAMVEEIKERQEQVDQAIKEIKSKKYKIEEERQQLDDDSKRIERAQEELRVALKDVESRSKSLKTLEISWNDRMHDLKDRERIVSESQRRMARQRASLEEREAQVVEDEERLRDSNLDISERRCKLEDMESDLLSKTQRLREREQEADTLLIAAKKDRELAAINVAQSESRLQEIQEKTCELEALSESIDARMKELKSLEERAEDIRFMEEKLAEKSEEIDASSKSMSERALELETVLKDLMEQEKDIITRKANLSALEQELSTRSESLHSRETALSSEKESFDKLLASIQEKERDIERQEKAFKDENRLMIEKMKEYEVVISMTEEKHRQADKICSKEEMLNQREEAIKSHEEISRKLRIKEHEVETRIEEVKAMESRLLTQQADIRTAHEGLEKDQKQLLDDRRALATATATFEEEYSREKKKWKEEQAIISVMQEAIDLKKEHIKIVADDLKALVEHMRNIYEQILKAQNAFVEQENKEINRAKGLNTRETSLEQQCAELELRIQNMLAAHEELARNEGHAKSTYVRLSSNPMNESSAYCRSNLVAGNSTIAPFQQALRRGHDRLTRLEALLQKIDDKHMIDRARHLRAHLSALEHQALPSTVDSSSNASYSFLSSDEEDDVAPAIAAGGYSLFEWEASLGTLLEDLLNSLRDT